MESGNRSLCRVVQSGKFVRNLTLDWKKGESVLHLPVTFSYLQACIQLPELPVGKQSNCAVKKIYDNATHITSMN